mgnify:CR=1 FL=1
MKKNLIIPIILLLLSVFALSSCSKSFTFPVSTLTPAADGEVILKKVKGSVYTFEVKVENLASPSRLTPSKSHYIVWAENDQGEYQNLGSMELSKKNVAKLEGALMYEPTYFFITAEDVINANWPGNQEIFRSERLRLK